MKKHQPDCETLHLHRNNPTVKRQKYLIDLAPRGAKRSDRAAVAIQKILSVEIGRLSDKRFQFLQITDTKLSNDLSHAMVYFSSLGVDSDVEGCALQSAIKRLIPLFRKRLGQQLSLRKVPYLTIRYDPRVRYQCQWGATFSALAMREPHLHQA